jgi:hypothetical protein
MINQVILERKIYRKRNRRKKWSAKRNYFKNLEKKSEAKKYKKESQRPLIIKIPPDFSMTSDLDGVIRFFHLINDIDKKKTKFVFFDFENVKKISHGSITILLSFIGWLRDHGIFSSGNYPTDPKTKKYFENSGFLDFFKKMGTRSYEKGKNTIVARGKERTDSELTAKLIRTATETIWGSEDRNTKVQGMLVELMANTVNHAYVEKNHQKGWYFSIDHVVNENKVKFCFVDNGSGILRTLHIKFADLIANFFGGETDSTILKKAFEGEFGSRTRLSNRGRGLKAIKKVFEQGYIKSLKVITNNVFYDLELGTARELNCYFNGTFYFWEIDQTCKR